MAVTKVNFHYQSIKVSLAKALKCVVVIVTHTEICLGKARAKFKDRRQDFPLGLICRVELKTSLPLNNINTLWIYQSKSCVESCMGKVITLFYANV
jgi:hypothetical protein